MIAEVLASVAEVMNVLSPPVVVKTEETPIIASDTLPSSDDSATISQPSSPTGTIPPIDVLLLNYFNPS